MAILGTTMVDGFEAAAKQAEADGNTADHIILR
jgi:hypothetical protein